MSENFNEAAETAAEAESRRRAERIAAIRKSVRNSSEDFPGSAESAANSKLPAAENAEIGGTSPAAEMNWEDEIAARISKHTDTNDNNRTMGAESIIRELDGGSAMTAEEIVEELPAQPESSTSADIDALIKELLSYGRNEPEPTVVPEPGYETEPVETGEYEPEPAVVPEPEQAAESVEDGANEPETPAAPEPEEKNATPEESAPAPAAAPVRAPKPLRKLTRLDSRPVAAPITPEEAVPAEPAEAIPAEPAAAPEKTGKKKKKKKRTFKEKLLGFFPQKKDSIPERIRKVVFLAAIAVIIVCGYIVGDYYIDLWRSKRENEKNMDNYWSVMDDVGAPEEDEGPDGRKIYKLLSGAKRLLEENSDVVGVIRIEGTPVNNPVMQADDNSKYLNRKLSGRESRAGELFLDYRNHFDEVDEEGHLICENSDNLVIYGHNMKDETMFGSLKYYDWYDYYYGEHPVIDLNSNYEQYKYKIFSILILDVEDESDTKFDCWNKLDFSTEEEFYEFVNEAKRRTLRLNDVDVEYGDKLLTLSTCNTVLGERGRLIIIARLVRDGEDPLAGTQNSTANPNIKWPNVYYDYKGIRKTYDPEAEFVPYGPSEDKTQKVSGDKK